jgi:hypothetical protein
MGRRQNCSMLERSSLTMCPFCLATIALATAGAATSTGWSALIASKYLKKKNKNNAEGSHVVDREL